MDVARTALRNGALQVTLYARGTHVAANSHEMAYAELDGAQFVFGKAIERITETGPVFKTSVIDENNKVVGLRGRRRPGGSRFHDHRHQPGTKKPA